MIDAITLETAHLLGSALPSAHRLRYRIFVERQKYTVPTGRGMEWDQFDTPLAVYLLWRDEHGEVRGVSRLIPTTQPYMLKDLWSQKLVNFELPRDPSVCEITRFGIDRTLGRRRQLVFGEMATAWFEYGLAYGIKTYVCMTPLRVLENAFLAAGCDVELLSEPLDLGGIPSVAARFDVTAENAQRIRDYHRIPYPVLRVPAETQALAA